jgi:hypothetical protein
MQKLSYPGGGFALFKVMVNGKKYSAYYNEKGKLVGAEWILPNGDYRHVPDCHTNIRHELQQIGRREAGAQS